MFGQGERAQQKIVLKFSGVKPRLPLNKTNALALSAAWGPESGNWIGHIIELVPQRVLFQGAFVDSIRINIPRDGAAARSSAAPHRSPLSRLVAASPSWKTTCRGDKPCRVPRSTTLGLG